MFFLYKAKPELLQHMETRWYNVQRESFIPVYVPSYIKSANHRITSMCKYSGTFLVSFFNVANSLLLTISSLHRNTVGVWMLQIKSMCCTVLYVINNLREIH